jgi:hypothetical protein
MKYLLFVGLSEAAITAAAQADLLPTNLISILAQLPLVAVIIWLQLQNQKWLEHMLDVQRKSIKEIYRDQQAFLNTLIIQIEEKQNRMTDEIENLARQVSLYGATLSEVANMNELVDRLMEKLQK